MSCWLHGHVESPCGKSLAHSNRWGFIRSAVLKAMTRGHRAALAALDRVPADLDRVVLTGGAADAVRHVLPEYAAARIEGLEEGSLRGVARLFDPPAG